MSYTVYGDFHYEVFSILRSSRPVSANIFSSKPYFQIHAVYVQFLYSTKYYYYYSNTFKTLVKVISLCHNKFENGKISERIFANFITLLKTSD